MLPHARLFLLLYAALVLDTALPGRAWPESAPVSFWPLVVCVAGLSLPIGPAVLWAAAVGLAADCLSAEPLGIEMLSSILAGAVFVRFRPERDSFTPLQTSGLSFLLVCGIAGGSHMLRHAVTAGTLLSAEEAFSAVVTAAYASGIALAAGLLRSASQRFTSLCR